MKHMIKEVVEKDLCVGCGTCYAACPMNAITLVKKDIFVPSIDAEKCNDCGICETVCPGYYVDYRPFPSKTKNEKKYVSLIGKYKHVFLGHAKDRYIRFMGTSGGALTGVLNYALENGIVDAALVVNTIGITPMITIAKSSTEVKQAIGSKYIPVPINIGLQEILNTDGRFAIVGLPCHLLGLSRISSVYPILAKRIVLKAGLFCGRGFDYHFVNYVLKDIGIHPTEVQKISFRGHGWPGKVSIEYIRGRRRRSIFLDYLKLGQYSGAYLFMPKRCFFCPDHTAELADISFGDAWLKEIRELDPEGTSIIVTRTARGDKILSEAVQANFIDVSDSSAEAVVRSQDFQINFHKLTFATRCRITAFLGVTMPSINVEMVTKKSFATLLFSTLLTVTQIAYGIFEKFGVSEFFPKSIVRFWGLFTSVLNAAGVRS